MFGYPDIYVYGFVVAAVLAGLLGVVGAWYYSSVRDADDPGAVGEATGASLADSATRLGSALWTVPGAFIRNLSYAIMRFLPVVGAKWWKGMAMFSLKAYYKRSGGDALGLLGNEHAEKASFAPVKWKDDVATDEDEQPGWKVKGEDRTFQDSNHDAVFRVGSTPIVLINEDERRSGSWLEANVTEAIDAGNMTEVYNVESAELHATVDYGNTPAAGNAVADGGASVQREFNPKSSPVFEDMFIDLTSEEEYDGRAISWYRYADHDPTTTAPEEIDRAQERGWLAGLAGHRDQTAFVIKVLLIALAMVATFVLGPEIVAAIFSNSGGGGGGGGGLVPFTLGVLLP